MSKYAVGSTFGRLTIVGKAEKKGTNSYLNCKCSCGNEEIIKVCKGNLSRGHTQSCGCLSKEKTTTHGKSNTRTYKIYKHMIQRTTNSSKDLYEQYGAIGIGCCERWLNCFENFLEDMGECPKDYSLDRIDNSKGYSPENCRWASFGVQVFNQKLRSDNTSGMTGVTQYPSGTWEARISYKKKIYVLGTFPTYEEACSARLEAELKYYGFYKREQ
jgi:hypothetical protein